MLVNINIVIIITAAILAIGAVYLLYAIIMFQGGKKDAELQLTTKNVLEQVKILFDKQEYALVELLASKYLERVPSHIEVRRYLAKAYFKSKKLNNTIKQCLVILKKDPNDIDTKKLLGDCYASKQLPNKAIKEYEEIFDRKSNDKEVLRKLAELYREVEQTYSSIEVYNILADLLTDNSEKADVQMILADLNEEVHDYPAAFEAYKTRLEIYPTDVITNQRLAQLYIKINNTSKAIETLLYMLSFVNEPKALLWTYEQLIELYVETEEYEKAIENSEKLLEVQGSDKFKVRNNIALYNVKLKNYDKGIEILEELALLSDNGYDVTIELADSYIQCQEYQKALDRYIVLLDKSTQREAKNLRLLICELYIAWATKMAEQEKFEDSFKYLDKAIEYNAMNPEIYYQIGLNNLAQKNYVNAVEFLNRSLEYDKFNKIHAKIFLKLSEAHHNLGNFFEEKKALTDLLKIDSNNALGLYRVGLMYIAQHDTKSAEESLKKALQIDPELLQAKYNLALLYESNNRERAKELYMEVLEQDPSYEEARNALTDLSSSDYEY